MTTNERPIIFSAPMVRALLAGTKTQTRRVVNPEGAHTLFQFRGTTAAAGTDEPTGEWAWCGSERVVNKHIRCPYGRPGDMLWVREAWKAHTTFDHLPPRDIPHSKVWYLADDGYKAESRTRASMHMPRWASRITLEITDVRVQRLHEISVADAMAEGVVETNKNLRGLEPCMEWIYAYEDLWGSINGPGSWDANPWVWVVEFKVAR